MGFTKYFSAEELVKAGRNVEDNYTTVTFDLFDTLVIRRVHDPDLVKLPVARFIANKAYQHGITVSETEVQRLRDGIEAEQRAETGLSFDDHEACYPDFMTRLLREVFNSDDIRELLSEVTAYELFMENQMLVPRSELVCWLQELANKGKRIVIVSDIYLPAEHLEVLVKHAGFLDNVEGVISSADSFLAKASGKAFPLLKDRYSLAKEGWLHVGDNPISDGLRPAEYGIDALVLHDAEEKRRKAITKRYINYSQGRPFWRGRALQQLMQPHEQENIVRSALYREGYNFLAPLIGGFLQAVAEKCLENSITKIFFLSREGYTFKRFWEQCMPALYPAGGLPEVEYLYVSRMALAGASCAYQGLTKTNADIAFLPAGNRDFRDVCRIFQLEADRFLPIFEKYDLKIDSCLSDLHAGYDQRNREKFNMVLGDSAFQDEVKRQTLPANQAMIRYFEEVGFFAHSQVALVDIGWLGTIPRFLYEAVRHRTDCPRVFNYMFGATRGIPYPASPDNILEGVMYDRDRFDLAASTILYARDLFEEACRAPHPTLNGYRLTDTGYALDFRETEDEIGQAELEQDEFYAPLQQGVIDAASRYGAASSLLGYSYKDYKPWLNYLMISKLAFPRTREVLALRHKHHLDDFHGTHKPTSAEFGRKLTSPWEASKASLLVSPFLRLRLFLRHLRERIKE